jgi:hypothetical protein
MKPIIKIISIFFIILIGSRTNTAFCQTGEALQLSPSCNVNTGRMSVTVTAPQATYPFPYTYTLYNEVHDFSAQQTVSSANTVFDGLPSGEYLIKVKLNPTTELRFCGEISDEIQLSGIVTPSCASNSGSIILNVFGGSQPYAYKWSNGATTASVSGLSPNEYTVTVTDNSGCVGNESFDVPGQDFIVDYLQSTSCTEQTTLIYDVNKRSSDDGFSFRWSTGSFASYTTVKQYGSYNVTITDHRAGGCVHVKEFEFWDVGFTLIGTKTNPTCSEGGKIDLNVTQNDESLLLKYIWSDGSTEEDRENLAPGRYCVQVTNGFSTIDDPTNIQGCQKSLCFDIIEPPFKVYQFINQKNCSGLPTSVSVAPIHNKDLLDKNFEIKWDDGVTTWERTVTSSGQHCYSVIHVPSGTCKKGCINVETKQHIAITTSAIPVCSSGQSTGKVTSTVTGGSAPYTYKWSNGATSKDISGLNQGIYSVTVTDKNNCTHVSTAKVELINVIVNIGHDENPLKSCTQHTIMPQYSIGSPSGIGFPLSYKWSNGATTSTLSVQSSGTYCVTATSTNQCTNSKCFEVSLQPTMTVSSSLNTNCPNPPGNGVINVNATGGTPPYQYSFNPGPQNTSNPSLAGLSPGSYHVVVSDVNGCKTSKHVQVDNNYVLNFTTETNDPCAGSNTGQVKIKLNWESILMNLYQVDINGNRVLYFSQYYFTDIIVVKDLPVGSYFVEVTDLNNCDYGYKTFEIKQSQNPSITDIIASTQCVVTHEAEASPGKITINSVIGGSQPFTYKWSTYDNSKDITVTTPGVYTVTVTDKNGCYYSKAFEVKTANQALFVNIAIDKNVDCTKKLDEVTLNVDILSGSPPYKIVVNGSETVTSSVNNKIKVKLNAGTWTSAPLKVVVSDNCGLIYENSISAVCTDLCPDNCIKFGLSTGGGCVKFSQHINPDQTFEGWLFPTKLEIKNVCNDDILRKVSWNWISSKEAHFKGKGTHSEHLEMTGALPFKIENVATGCIQNKVLNTPKPCKKSIFKWFSDTFSGTGLPPKPCDGLNKEFVATDHENCEKLFKCTKNNTDVFERESFPKYKCSVKCGEESLDFEYCSIDCKAIYLGKGINQYKKCKSCVLNDPYNRKLHDDMCYASPPAIPAPTCTDIIKSVVFDSLFNVYVAFYNGVDSLNKKYIYGYMLDETLQEDYEGYSAIETDLELIDVKLDNDHNHYILGKDGIHYFQKNSYNGQPIWSLPISDMEIKKVIQNGAYFNLIGTNKVSNKWFSSIIDQNGNLVNKNELNIGFNNYSSIEQVNQTVVSYDSGTKKLYFFNSSIPIEVSTPVGIAIKSIKSNEKGNAVVIGELYSSVVLQNNLYDPANTVKPIVMTYDLSGNLLKVNVGTQGNSFTVYDALIVNDKKAFVFGEHGTIHLGIVPDSNSLEYCSYIWYFSLEEKSCPAFTSTLTSHRTPCQLTWNAPPAGYTTELQWNENGIWIEVSSIGLVAPGYTSPFTVLKDGTYRLIHKKEGCPDVVSNSVTTTCHGICVCPVPVLTYDSQACHITWSTVACPGYTARLQSQNANGGWDDIALTAASPYTVTIAGIYRILLTKPGCSQVLSNVVTTTACTSSTNPCTCTTASQLTLNTSACSLSWTTPSCSGYTSTLQRFVAGAWTPINSTSPYAIPANNNGQYRILTSKPGCGDLVSNVVSASCSCSSPSSITVFNSTYGLGQNVNLQKSQTYMHNVTSGHPNVCDDQFIELRFDANVVNSDWNISGTVGILPATVINGYYTFTVILPDPPSSGYGDVWMQSPCGDYYTLRLVYDCVMGCLPIDINVVGEVNYSCQNLTITTNGGTSPYSFQISGVGNLGTSINQTGSSNIINLQQLQNSELINLSILVTDINGCTSNSNVLYSRCPVGCNNGNCSTQICNGVLTHQSGFGIDAIINYIVPDNVSQLTINFEPVTGPQSYIQKINGDTIINVPNIYGQSVNTTKSSCQNDGINIYATPLNFEINGNTGLYNILWLASNTISVTPGDLIEININHPPCTGPTSWYLQINCEGTGNKPLNYNIFLNNMNLEDVLIEPNIKEFDNQLENIVRFYPNPFSKGINMEFTAPQSDVMKMEVYNNVGVQIFSKTIDLMQGINLRYIDEFENMPSGVYTVKMRGTQTEHNTRVIKIE